MTSNATDTHTGSKGKAERSAVDSEAVDTDNTTAKRKRETNSNKRKTSTKKKQCGLCGSKNKLTKTECCNKWICDDEDNYVMFSYARNSCYRNHARYTLCSFHHNEGHDGSWQQCNKCREEFEPEMVVWYGTNEHNIEEMIDPPAFTPTYCVDCAAVINLGEGGYSWCRRGYSCLECAMKTIEKH